MTNSVDDEIVSMKFDNSQFEPALAKTIGSMDKLKQSLNFGSNKNGLDQVQASASRFSLGAVATSIEGVNKKFLAMSTIGITALANITNRAVNAGINVAKSLTISPIMDGFREYQKNLESVQTIQANTGASIGKVNKALDQLNHYSDQTIYNFAEMAKNIGTFTAAGVDLDTSVQSIKGIANLAALSGSSSEQASSAMYQLSQAIATGKVGLQDWNSVVNAGMGGKQFQTSLARTAENMGTLSKGSVKLGSDMKLASVNGESFRESIQAGPNKTAWLTSGVLTETLKQISGGYTNAELAAKGYSKEQIKAIQSQARTAFDAATKIKTLPQLFGVIQESIGSTWAGAFRTIMGDFTQARNLWSNVGYQLIGPHGFITRIGNNFNDLLSGWAKLGGRKDLLGGLKAGFKALFAVLTPIKDAFREIFPAKTSQDLADMTKNFRDFMESLMPAPTTLALIGRTAKGFFAALDIGWQIVKGVAGVIGDLIGLIVGGGGPGFLAFTANIGDMIVRFDEALKKGQGLTKFFDGITKVLTVPIKLIQALGHAFASLFTGADGKAGAAVEGSLGRVGDRLSGLVSIIDKVKSAFENFVTEVGQLFAPLGQKIAETFSGLGDAIAQSISSGSFDAVFDVLNTGLLAGIVVLLKKFFTEGFNINIDPTGGLFSKIGENLDAMKEKTKAMTLEIKAGALMKIAIAIGILAASMVALSLIDSAALTKALTAMAVGFGQLLAGMAVLTKISGAAGFVKVPVIAGAMVLLATAIAILTGAIAVMSLLSWNQIAKGLTGIAGALVIISSAMRMMPKGMVAQAAALTLIGFALGEIGAAMAIFGSLSWESIGKGLTGVAGALVIIAGAMQLMPINMPVTAAGLVLVGGALNAIGVAMLIFATMNWESIGKGLVSIAGALLIIAGAMQLMPLNMPVTAAGLIMVGIALNAIGGALKIMGGMSWEEIGKGLVTMAGALAILAGALYLMTGSLAGSAALIIAAGALAILTPVIVTLGAMSWDAIIKGLTALGGALAIIGLAGLLLTPVVPSLIGLGLALVGIGAGLALAGAGALAFATAFGIVVTALTVNQAILIGVLTGLIGLIPQAMASFGQGIIAFASQIAQGGPAFLAAFTTILTSLLNAVIKVIPKVGQAFMTLLRTAAQIVVQGIPLLITVALKLIMSFLSAIRDNIGPIVDIAGDIIIRFIRALGKKAPDLADAAAKAIIDFMNGLSKAIDDNADEMGEAGGRIGISIAKGVITGLGSMVGEVGKAASDLGGKALGALHNVIKNPPFPSREGMKLGKSLGFGFAVGISQQGDAAASAGRDVATTAMDAVHTTLTRLTSGINGNMDLNPTITPVLDLGALSKQATKISSLIGPTVTTAVSFDRATSISASRKEAQAAAEEAAAAGSAPTLLYEQNITSPRALDEGELYRLSNNMMSRAKQALIEAAAP